MTTFITEKSKDYSLLDNNTGELLEYRKTRRLSFDEFIMVFISSFPSLMKLKGIQLKVLICCWKYSSYNKETDTEGNVIHNTATFKQYCHNNGLDTSDACIDRAFVQLRKSGLLIKRCKGEYILNPKYFFKGTLSARTKIAYDFVVEPEDDNVSADNA